MSKDDVTTQEQIFRVVYAAELKKKRDNELHDERRRVNYQEGKTPGRRGETIMQDEISKETIRRYYLNQKSSKPNSDRCFNPHI
jgi:arginyl-tRNA synthetase